MNRLINKPGKIVLKINKTASLITYSVYYILFSQFRQKHSLISNYFLLTS